MIKKRNANFLANPFHIAFTIVKNKRKSLLSSLCNCAAITRIVALNLNPTRSLLVKRGNKLKPDSMLNVKAKEYVNEDTLSSSRMERNVAYEESHIVFLVQSLAKKEGHKNCYSRSRSAAQKRQLLP